MSPLPPLLATTAPAPRTDFVRPLALASLLISAAMLLWFAVQALVAWPLGNSALWQHVIALATEQHWPPSLRWMLVHPLATSLLLAAACLPSLLASWGLWKGTRWGLIGFVWLLVLTGIGNFGVAWWMDRVASALIMKIDDPGIVHELQVQRLLFTATVVGGSLLLGGLQGWLAWRLMRPDIRSRYPRFPH